MSTTFQLTDSEAIVLFEFLSSLEKLDIQYNHPSEEIVLNNLLAYLESNLDQTFQGDYVRQLIKARNSFKYDKN